MKRNIKQLRAISYAITRQKEQKATKVVAELKAKGIDVKVSRYPEVTLRRCTIAKGE